MEGEVDSFCSNFTGNVCPSHSDVANPRSALAAQEALGDNDDLMELLPEPDETLDTFLDGKVKVLQKRQGYRFSVDAVLLSQFIRLRNRDKAIDLGTGCGILPLLLSQTTEGATFVGVEIQKDLVALAKRNVALNHLENRIAILHQDLRNLPTEFPPGTFNVAFSNPPYRRRFSGRTNPSMEKAIARHEIEATLDDLIWVTSFLLASKGRSYLIYPASRAIDLMVVLRKNQLEPKRVRWVHPRPDREARWVLVEALKASGVELHVIPPLFLRPEKPQGDVPRNPKL